MRISDWSSDVCSSDLAVRPGTPEDAATAVVDTESADDDNDGVSNDKDQCPGSAAGAVDENGCPVSDSRSEEHTSELQSLMRISYAVFCLKKKKTHKNIDSMTSNYHHTNTTLS